MIIFFIRGHTLSLNFPLILETFTNPHCTGTAKYRRLSFITCKWTCYDSQNEIKRKPKNPWMTLIGLYIEISAKNPWLIYVLYIKFSFFYWTEHQKQEQQQHWEKYKNWLARSLVRWLARARARSERDSYTILHYQGRTRVRVVFCCKT